MDETTHLFLEIEPGSEAWTVAAPSLSHAPHVATNPLEDASFLGEVRELREWASRPIVRGDPLAPGTRDYLDRLSRKVGERITSVLLAETARAALVDELRRTAGRKVRLTIRVRDAGPLGDAALALPWELLAPEPGVFALRSRSLQLIREVVMEGAPDLPVPEGSLEVAVMIAAPEDRTVIPYEEESFRLQLALSPLGHEVAFSDLGGLRDLVQLVEDQVPNVIHFSGHGLPGKLLFENELGFTEEIAVEEVQRQLHQVLLNPRRAGSFPRLFFLSSCSGAARGPVPDDSLSTAAALHRRGFAQVLGYFGPLDAELSSRAEETFYGALACGATALAAAEALRDTLDRPLEEGGERVYPLAWSQLAVYHRGPDLPLAARAGASSAQAAERSRRRMVQVSGLPVLERGFIGRRGLQHEVLRRIHRGQRLIVLQGLGGLGKTALASHLVSRVFASEKPADQLILRCRELDDSEDPILDLQAQAEEHGRVHGFPDWDERMKNLRQRIPETAAGCAAVIREIRNERPGLVVYADNAESLQAGPTTNDARVLGCWRPGVESWWEQIEQLAEEGLLIFASTRYGWEGLDVRAHCGIDPMSPADTLRLIASFEHLEGLPLGIRKRLALGVDGHPRTIELLDRLVGLSVPRSASGVVSDASWQEVIEPLLSEKKRLIDVDLLLPILWRRISRKARMHARRLIVLRSPARHQVIDRLGEFRDELIRSGILTRHRASLSSREKLTWLDVWGLHGLVRAFLEKLPIKGQAIAHRKVGVAFRELVLREDGTWSDCEEAIYHFFAIKRANQIWPLTERYVIRLRYVGRYREALDFLGRCEACGVAGDQLAKALTLMVQIRIGLGERSADLNLLIERSLVLATKRRSRRLILHESASLLYQQARYAEAEAAIRQALALAEALADEDDLTSGASLRMLANILEKQGRFSDAEELLEGVLDRLARSSGVDSAYGATLFALAQCLERHGNYSRAEETLRQVVDLFENSLGEAHHQYGLALHALANILLNRGEYTEAEGLLRRALSIYGAALGTEHPDYGLILRTLSEVLMGHGKLEEAESMLRDALDVEQGFLGARHPDFISTLHTLAHILEAQGRYSEAEQLFREALRLDEEVRKDDYVSLTSSLVGLGSCLLSQGKLEEAVENLDRAVKLSASFLGETHPFHGSALQALAEALSKQGKYVQAESRIRQALSVKEVSLGSRHLSYSSSLVVLGQILDYQGRYEEEESVLRQAATIRGEILGREHPEYGSLLHSLGITLVQQGKDGQAEASFRESLRIAESSLGEDHPVIYPTLTSLAITLANQGKAEEGESHLLRALAIVERVHAPSHPDHAEILSALAQLQFALGKPSAFRSAIKALKELDGSLESADPMTRAAVANLRTIIELGLSEIRDLAVEARDLAVASLKSSQGALQEALAARLEAMARQVAEGEEAGSPWLDLEEYFRCVISALRGETSSSTVPAAFSDHWQAIQAAADALR